MGTAPKTLPPKLGKYEVRREIGRGGMGVVYEGYDPVINRRVALKTLIGELFSGPEANEYLRPPAAGGSGGRPTQSSAYRRDLRFRRGHRARGRRRRVTYGVHRDGVHRWS